MQQRIQTALIVACLVLWLLLASVVLLTVAYRATVLATAAVVGFALLALAAVNVSVEWSARVYLAALGYLREHRQQVERLQQQLVSTAEGDAAEVERLTLENRDLYEQVRQLTTERDYARSDAQQCRQRATALQAELALLRERPEPR